MGRKKIFTDEERKERRAAYNKRYKEANKEKISAYHKKHREDNKDKTKARYQANKEERAAYSKKYNEANKEKIATYNKKYHEANKEKVAAQRKRRYEANREKYVARNKKYREANKEKATARAKKHYEANKERIAAYANMYVKDRRKSDPLYRLTLNIRNNVTRYLKGGKSKRTQEILGMSFKNFQLYLEVDYTDGMNLDHIVPISWAKTDEEVYCLNHFSNFQILTAEENFDKGNRFVRKENLERTLEFHNNVELLNKIINRNLDKIT